ncbi:response regulator [Paenibacillus sp. NPDC056579]|uniref:response regulator transcription factor n=1 Tax=unclassified Paenibacillus TaxID=185978 RepID=UPI001EF99EEE|nr:response regulator transcription factor [Paenibacillus sp. H1-7]ULL18948.1 DNA-binding response regulator [Paenibacillus sp. H1-7]
MYKVMIVEDEWLVREGLKQTIPWEQVGCELVGEAGDGITALERIESLQPDILLSDIRMPGLSGIELAQRITERLPKLKIVFLTGFDDFVIAQKAIKLGAADFILKPTNPDELMEVFGRIKAKLDEERANREQSERLELSLVIGQPFIMEKLLYDMMLEHAGTFEFELFEEYCLQDNKTVGAYRIVLLNAAIPEAERAKTSRTEQWLTASAAVERLTSFPMVRIGKSVYALLANRSTERTDMTPVLSLLTDLARMWEGHVSVGVSTLHDGAATIAQAYEEALQAIYGTLWSGGSPLVWYDELDRESPSLITAAPSPIDISLTELIKRGTQESIEEHIARWKSHWLLQLSQDIQERSRFFEWLVALYSSLLKDEELKHIGLDPQLLLSPLEESESPDRQLTRLRGMLIEWQRRYKGQGRDGGGFEQIEAFIRQHYSEDITLQEIADRHHMSESHFSRLFKQHVGSSFLEYLTNVRVQKAKELLVNPKLKIYEVAVSVGYQDSRYFSQIYRKYTGETPTEFRKRLGIEFIPL